ncbi:acid-sensing ion channel 2-like isoform X3 [Branchiostoma floridae x Branchiostoma belcheri]
MEVDSTTKDMGKEDSFTPLALAATPDVREVKPVQCVPTSTVGTGYTSYRKPSRFRRFAMDTDIHGMKHLIKRGPIRRTAWVLMLLLSLGLMSFECMESLIYYFEYHHVTKVELQYAKNMTFPAVTICNMNKYRRSALKMRDLATVGPYIGIVDQEKFQLKNEHLYPKEWVDFVRMHDLKTISKTSRFPELSEFVKRVGHQIKQMIISCEWRGETCSEKNFTHIITHLGNCFTFNGAPGAGGTVLSSSKPGEGNGLKVTINIENDEYMATNDVAGDAMDAGIKVMVHPQHEPPFVKELGFAVSPGFHTFVAIRKEVITTLPAPYGNCQDEGSQKYFPHYSLSACRIECETEYVINECGCRLVEMPGNVPVCTPKMYECAYGKLLKVTEGDLCACRSPCHNVQYNVKLSTLKLRPKSVAEVQKMDSEDDFEMSHKEIHDNILVLNVYYESLNYELIQQMPAIETEGLLGDLGGQMGLFLGASFLSLVEIFEYLMDELYDYGKVLRRCCKSKAASGATNASHCADVVNLNINGSATQLPQTSRA